MAWGKTVLRLGFILCSCGRADSTMPPAAVYNRASSPPEILDSVTAVRRDGLEYEPLNTGTYQQLPADLTSILNRKYPGWVLPALPETLLREDARNAEGPYFVTGDFDENGQQDYAVQFRQHDSITVAAFLFSAEKKPRQYVLLKLPAMSGPEKQNGLFLEQEKAGAKYYNPGNKQEQVLSRDAVGIGTADKYWLFVFRENSFAPLQTVPKSP